MQPTARRIALVAVQAALAAAGIFVILLLFSRPAHASPAALPPLKATLTSTLSGPTSAVSSATSPVTSTVGSATSPVTSAVGSATVVGHVRPSRSPGSTTSSATAERPQLSQRELDHRLDWRHPN